MTTISTTAIVLSFFAAADGLTVLEPTSDGVKPNQLLYRHFQKKAHAALDARRRNFEKLLTVEQGRAHQRRMRKFFVKQLGGFPKRTPLNAKTVGVLDGDGYRIEKIIFESRPNHHVTATLYLPKTKPPYPGVVVASGHSATGKAAAYNQRYGIIMAKHGMAAICFDPIGQGERYQNLNARGKPKSRSTTREHFLMGVGSILVGRNTAGFLVWDGMRCIDYLTSRKDINAKKIGFTGCSGGGTQTSYVMALDDRVTCAAPSCYLTTFRKLIDTIGPQDAEQNIFGQIAFGMDHPDYIFMRAPKPTIISATTKDFFNITGTWDNFRQAKRFYGTFGHPERVSLVEGPGGHGVPMGNLNAIASWMQRWLLDKHDPIRETDIPVRPTGDLQCTPKGQVLLLPRERSVFQLNAERGVQFAKRRAKFWSIPRNRGQLRQKIRELAGIRPLKDIPTPKTRNAGFVKRSGYRIEKLVFEVPGSVPLPALRFVPTKPNGDVTLYLHGRGKQIDADSGGQIQKLVKRGHVVLAVDLSGIGETRGAGSNKLLGDWKNFYMAYLLGESLVGRRAEETLMIARQVANARRKSFRRVHLTAVGETAIPALHAASLEPSLFASVTLRHAIRTWSDVVRAKEPKEQLLNTVHGALEFYDLPDLVKLVGVKKVTFEAVSKP